MLNKISGNSQSHFGKACIVGTHIPVQRVLELLRDEISFDKITRDYCPDLEIEVMVPSTQNAVHHELKMILANYSEHQIKSAFVVVEPSGHRFRKVPGKQ
jgi:hypothetical protein